MRIRTPARILAITAVSVLALGASACTQAEQKTAEANVDAAGEKAADVAAQTGEVVESGAMKAAQAVESGAGKVADKLEAEQAEAAREGRPGAVDPATDTRVPAKD
ncbi:hypothetical protein [Brevundimonas sp.]|uniref:hypothetical protein n=1 Tax=Brevundimonas sp. TaxID=1871086 RepID=UPI002EDAE832